MIEIKPFTDNYSRGLADLILPIQQQEFGIPITYEQQPDLHDIENFYRKGAGDFWLAIDDGRVVGSVALIDIGNSQVALRKMFVAASHRGAAHGVAQKLFENLLIHARDHQIKSIYLGTTDKFLAAHRFYEKNEFRRVAVEDLPTGFPRMAVDSIFYVLEL